MSDPHDVALQADVGNLPATSLSILDSLQRLLIATSADDVQPLAVRQMELIGSCFLSNGPIAARLPDLLIWSNSVRLERIQQWVGWMAGDTASFMAQTSGGRAISLLSLALREVYDENETGTILYRLSQEILPGDLVNASILQLGRVASVLSKKLAAVGFGSHWAYEVTRIRAVYFNVESNAPPGLLKRLTLESVTELLVAVKRALQEDNSILHFEGHISAGQFVALVMALCPEDVTVQVENEIIFKGLREQIIVSVRNVSETKFGVRMLLHSEKGNFLDKFVCASSENVPPVKMSMAWRGYLAAWLDIGLGNVGVLASDETRSLCADLIVTILFTIPIKEFGNSSHSLVIEHNLGFLLGPLATQRVRDTLTAILLVEPSFAQMDCVSAYANFNKHIKGIIPSRNRCNISCQYCRGR